jgi:hypothetical protein
MFRIQKEKSVGHDRWTINFFSGFVDLFNQDMLAVVEESWRASTQLSIPSYQRKTIPIPIMILNPFPIPIMILNPFPYVTAYIRLWKTSLIKG